MVLPGAISKLLALNQNQLHKKQQNTQSFGSIVIFALAEI